MKKIICITLCVIMALAFVGCSNNSKNEAQTDETTSEETVEPTEEPEAEEAATPEPAEEPQEDPLALTQETQAGELNFMLTKNSIILDKQENSKSSITYPYYIIGENEEDPIATMVITSMKLSDFNITKDMVYTSEGEQVIESAIGT